MPYTVCHILKLQMLFSNEVEYICCLSFVHNHVDLISLFVIHAFINVVQKMMCTLSFQMQIISVVHFSLYTYSNNSTLLEKLCQFQRQSMYIQTNQGTIFGNILPKFGRLRTCPNVKHCVASQTTLCLRKLVQDNRFRMLLKMLTAFFGI